jgi:hypothetical protein
MKQTAVEWLETEIDNNDMGEIPMWIYAFIRQAKAMEKEQLCKMYVQGRNDNHLDYYPEKHARETYDEFFKQD